MTSAKDPPAPELRELLRPECLQLLATGSVGRVAVIRHVLPQPMPAIVPVNYALDGGDVVFRTAASTVLLDSAQAGATVAFEADDLDFERCSGWSVTVTGPIRLVTDPSEVEHAMRLPIHPWAPGARDHVLCIQAQFVSGRRITRPDSAASAPR
jgi:nitroimidazol reductase NimA-like FMN-containing flavoprotein (pyridoxamine 5'-phosphate oxidase superfamily)